MKPDTRMDAGAARWPLVGVRLHACVCVCFLSGRLLHFILQHLSARAVASEGQLLSAAVTDVC